MDKFNGSRKCPNVQIWNDEKPSFDLDIYK